MLNVLSPSECRQIIDLTESIGYRRTCIAGIAAQDKALRGPDKVVWCADQHLVDAIFERCKSLLPPSVLPDERPLVGICPRFRCLRYKTNQHQLGPHRDRGLYPLSQVDEDGELRYDILKDGSRSYMSFLIYLNEEFEGGETFFYQNNNENKNNEPVPDRDQTTDRVETNQERTGNQRFSKGDRVRAVWSGDDDWYEAEVLAVNLDDNGSFASYDVRFTDDDQVCSGCDVLRA